MTSEADEKNTGVGSASVSGKSVPTQDSAVAERDQLKRKLQDALHVSAAEYSELIDYIEGIQHLRVVTADTVRLEQELVRVRDELAVEQQVALVARQEAENLRVELKAALAASAQPTSVFRRIFSGGN